MIRTICTLALLLLTGLPALAQNPYAVEHFDGAYTLPNWYNDGFQPGPKFITDGFLNGAIRLTACASSSSSSHCSTSTSSYGEETAVSICKGEIQHAGYKAGTGSGTGCIDNGNGMHEETWYRFHIRLAPGYLATPGTQNALMEFHVDSKSEADAKAHGGVTAYSTEFNIIADGTSCSGSPAYCPTPGTNPRLFIQVPGGATSGGTKNQKRFFPFASNSLLVDHWYDMVLHMVWDPSPTVGYVQWWVDGTKVLDVFTPTLYVRSDGTWGYGESLGLYNYRHWASWASSVDGDEFTWGPTASSIGFNPGGGGPPPPPPPPNPPSGVMGSDQVTASATISWTASSSSGVSSYNVLRSLTSGTGYVSVGTTTGLSFTDLTVKNGTTYYYVVQAVDSGVNSLDSSEIQVVVP